MYTLLAEMKIKMAMRLFGFYLFNDEHEIRLYKATQGSPLQIYAVRS